MRVFVLLEIFRSHYGMHMLLMVNSHSGTAESVKKLCFQYMHMCVSVCVSVRTIVSVPSLCLQTAMASRIEKKKDPLLSPSGDP